MTWRYVAVKHVCPTTGEIHYGLHEEYPTLSTTERTYTLEEVTVTGETPEDLAGWLIQAATDVLKHPPVEDQ